MITPEREGNNWWPAKRRYDPTSFLKYTVPKPSQMANPFLHNFVLNTSIR
jgi:hypothetical protein